MGVNTFSAAVHIAPVVLKTIIQHEARKGHKLKDGVKKEDATDDVFFDEAFHIVKAFIKLGTKNTVESLQAFTNTHVPAPPWAAVAPMQVPLTSCNKAADALIEWFGPDDLKHIVGGERWWQIRGLDGIDSEWITENKFLQNDEPHSGKHTDAERLIIRMEHLETVMLYVHGGAYFWGSINTHRYQIIRYARKMKGRAFAVNYRKAPQYPWPCPLQDVLAAYFYLIDPPPNAVHKAIPPSKIVFAGDSAGAGLCLTALTVLRDLNIPQPAGAVLISPWVDLTHSFPSVMQNTATDIIPPHGFIHKPSMTWPVNPVPEADGRARVIPTQTNPPPKPGHADRLQPSSTRAAGEKNEQKQAEDRQGQDPGDWSKPEQVGSQQEMLEKCNGSSEGTPSQSDIALAAPGDSSPTEPTSAQSHRKDGFIQNGNVQVTGEEHANGGAIHPEHTLDADDKAEEDAYIDFWEPKPPKVLMDDPQSKPLELRAQIQLYATNEQLTHPLVSPVLQGSLGNLCPLYIIAGDGEVLRDEIIYMAHKAAHPADYPTRKGTLREGRRQRENAQKFQTPTKVHLQVFDGMCHVLTVFSFTRSASYAYRSIAQFIKHVTTGTSEHLARNPFPELHISPEEMLDHDWDEEDEDEDLSPKQAVKHDQGALKKMAQQASIPTSPTGSDHFKHNEEAAKDEVKTGQVDQIHPEADNAPADSSKGQDIPRVIMIRERVDVLGHVRAMEPKDQIPALQLSTSTIGIIKEAPVKRWLAGQEIWDKNYKSAARKVIARRQQYERKAERLLKNAEGQGTIHQNDCRPAFPGRDSHLSVGSGASGQIELDRRWGPLDIVDENPPSSAIAGRRDTPEAIALLKKNIYHTAPATHRKIPKLKTSDAIRAAFDRDDHPSKPPPQSVSEQQIHPHGIPIHGVRIWQSLITYFMRKSSRKAAQKAAQGRDHAASALQETGKKLSVGNSFGNSQDAEESKHEPDQP